MREFAHLKWGLFDEGIPASDKTSDGFYIKDMKFIEVGYELIMVGYSIRRLG